MIAVHNEVPFLISSSSRSGLTVTLALLKATHMPSLDIKFFTAVYSNCAVKLAAQGGSVDWGRGGVVAVVGPDRESDPVQDPAGGGRSGLRIWRCRLQTSSSDFSRILFTILLLDELSKSLQVMLDTIASRRKKILLGSP